MATAFFGSNFFGGEFFSSTGDAVVEVVKTGTGGIDPPRRRLGNKAWQLPPKKPLRQETPVERRLAETAEIHAEVAGQLAKELRGEADAIKPISQMTGLEIDQEIGKLLRQEHSVRLARQSEDDETLMLMTLML